MKVITLLSRVLTWQLRAIYIFDLCFSFCICVCVCYVRRCFGISAQYMCMMFIWIVMSTECGCDVSNFASCLWVINLIEVGSIEGISGIETASYTIHIAPLNHRNIVMPAFSSTSPLQNCFAEIRGAFVLRNYKLWLFIIT